MLKTIEEVSHFLHEANTYILEASSPEYLERIFRVTESASSLLPDELAISYNYMYGIFMLVERNRTAMGTVVPG